MQSYRPVAGGKKEEANKPASQPSGPLGVFLTVGGIALVSNQIMP